MAGNEGLSASLEDYIETIYVVGLEQDAVRPKDIIPRMAVSGPSVTEALRLLAEKRLINYTPYGPVSLTPAGLRVAKEVYHRHQALKRFFIEVLGLDEQLAEEGACKMEHSASANIINRVVEYTRFVQKDEGGSPSAAVQRFRAFLEQQADAATAKGEGQS